MKSKLLGGLVTIAMFVVGCNANMPSPTVISKTTPAETILFPPPSERELQEGDYSHPELPRITAEQLKLMMDEGQTSPDVFVLVYIELSRPSEQIEDQISSTEYILGTTKFISFQTTSLSTPLSEDILFVLHSLPKDKPIIFYDSGEKDVFATTVAQELINLGDGHNPENIRVLWMGLSEWKKLGYPYYPNSTSSGL